MITINGKEIPFEPGQTILEAAKNSGIYIPTLCFHPCLPTQSACRLCLVEIEGARLLAASCSYPLKDGMKIETDTERVKKTRKTIMDLTIRTHDLKCATCDKNGVCELQRIAYDMGLEESSYGHVCREDVYDDSSPAILRDMTQCILCGRCVAACNEMMVNEVLGFTQRGSETKVSTAFDEPLMSSTCVICGACVAACPVNAIIDHQSLGRGRPFEMQKTQIVCPYCGVGCVMELNSRDNKLIRMTTDEPSHVNGIMTCAKGKFGMDYVNHQDRLTTPLIKEKGKFREATWEEALDLIASNLLKIKEKYGPESLAGFSSSKCTNEENYLMQKMVRSAFGTNNVDNCARLCHASTVAGLKKAFGSGAMTNSISEIPQTDVFLITGSNTTDSHPVIGSHIKRAIKYGGAKLIVVDPRKIPITRYADVWLRPKNGTDVAWINGLINIILKEGLADEKFIKERCTGFDDLRETVQKYTPEYVEKISGIKAEDLQNAAKLFGSAAKGAIYYAMG
ncbi:MAG: molybdopterin-dependent oxidoreductase, partial [Candidatus Ranarchaeia archaeon]